MSGNFFQKPSQAKAYAEAFTVKNRHKTHIEFAQSQLFPQGATITWGIGHLVELSVRWLDSLVASQFTNLTQSV